MSEVKVVSLEDLYADAFRRGIDVPRSVGRAVATGDMVGVVVHPTADDPDSRDTTCYRVDQSLVEALAHGGGARAIQTFSISEMFAEILYGARCDELGMIMAVRAPERSGGLSVIQFESQDGGGIAGATRVPEGWSVWAHRKHGLCVGAVGCVLQGPVALKQSFMTGVMEGYAIQLRQKKAREDALWNQVKSPSIAMAW